MLDNLTVRNKFLVAGFVPAVFLVALAVLAFTSAGSPLLGGVAALAAPASVAVAYLVGERTGRRLAALAEEIAALDLAPGRVGTGQHDPSGAPDRDAEHANEDETDELAGSANETDRAASAADEIGTLARAAGELMQRAAVSAASHHEATATKTTALLEATIREGLDLIGAQLDEIDALESTEDDAERLDRLFLLDHLTARLNRGLGRLLVLAGNDSIRSRSAPAPVVDVIRVAMGENTTYRNIELRTLDEVMIAPTAACELAQLLSELLANSTANSELDTPTEVFAAHLDDGSYRVTIIDRGTGVDAAELDTVRSIVSDPLDIADLPDTRIGLNVVGRLARHLGAGVDFSATAGSGLTVDVRLPAELVSEAPPTTPTISSPAEVESRPANRFDGDGRDRRHAPAPTATPQQPSSPSDGSTSNGAAPAGAASSGAGEAWTPPALPPRVREAVADPLGEAGFESPRPEPDDAETSAAATTDGDATAPTVADVEQSAAPSPESDSWTPPALPPRGSGGIATAIAPAPTESSATDEPARHDSSQGPAVLTRRRRGEQKAPASTGSPVRASTRSPKETRSLITTYRKGLRDGRKESPADD